jgi:hypothetical protein
MGMSAGTGRSAVGGAKTTFQELEIPEPVEHAGMARERHVNALLTVLGLSVVVFGAVGAAAVADFGPFADQPVPCADYEFSSTAWRQESSRDNEAQNLARCHVLLGMTKPDVRRMLAGGRGGQPSSGGPGGPNLTYLIGEDFLDSNFLRVVFGDGGHVIDAQIYTG